jgi:hypothetical protein
MEIILLVNSIDVTAEVGIEIEKNDTVNDDKDELSFTVTKHGSRGFTPLVNQEVSLTIDGTKEFGGVIVEVKKSIQDGKLVVYEVDCVDYTQYLGRKLVMESYLNKTVNYIIADIVSKYAPDFTVANVDCDITIDAMQFNRITIPECLEKLCNVTNYYWYVDYEKGIHFFEDGDNDAPFGITDDNGNYIRNSLSLSDKIDQIRNQVSIRGSMEIGEPRTENYVGTASQMIFPLASKFSDAPDVEIDESPATVGVENLNSFDDHDCLWSYEQKSLRFESDMDGKAIKITGTPEWPILIRKSNYPSIAEYGVYEFYKEDKSLTSRSEAIDYATAQLEAYKDAIVEGSFDTAVPGLRSGQTINIDSDLLGVDEDFVIQKVSMKIDSYKHAVWSVDLATMRTIDLIKVLQDLVRYRAVDVQENEPVLKLQELSDAVTVGSACAVSKKSPPYYWDDGGVTAGLNIIYWDLFTWS